MRNTQHLAHEPSIEESGCPLLEEPLEPSSASTCYGLITPDYGVSIAAVYQYQDGAQAAVEGSGDVSPLGQSSTFRRQEAEHTRAWYAGITQDIWG